MKLMVISDVHGHTKQVGALHEACAGVDALIMCGDFTTFGSHDQIQRVADALRVPDLPCYFVIGNCDCMELDGALNGWTNLHARCVTLGEWTLTGLGGALPCPSPTPTEFPESEYDVHLKRLYRHVRRMRRGPFWSSTSPYGTSTDMLHDGTHVGSHALRALSTATCLLPLGPHPRSRIAQSLRLYTRRQPRPLCQGHVCACRVMTIKKDDK